MDVIPTRFKKLGSVRYLLSVGALQPMSVTAVIVSIQQNQIRICLDDMVGCLWLSKSDLELVPNLPLELLLTHKHPRVRELARELADRKVKRCNSENSKGLV